MQSQQMAKLEEESRDLERCTNANANGVGWDLCRDVKPEDCWHALDRRDFSRCSCHVASAPPQNQLNRSHQPQ